MACRKRERLFLSGAILATAMLGAACASTGGRAHKATRFNGVSHYPLGHTTISLDKDSLQVSGSGALGLVADFGERSRITGFGPSFDFDAARLFSPGVAIAVAASGSIDGLPAQAIESITLSGLDGAVSVQPSFHGLGSATYRLELYRDGKAVHSQEGMSGAVTARLVEPEGEFSRAKRHVCLFGTGIVSVHFGRRDDRIATAFRLAGTDVLADEAKFFSERKTFEADVFSSATIRATGLPGFRVTQEHLHTGRESAE